MVNFVKELFGEFTCTFLIPGDNMTLNKIYSVYYDNHCYTIYNDTGERELFFPMSPHGGVSSSQNYQPTSSNRSMLGSHFKELQEIREEKLNIIINDSK